MAIVTYPLNGITYGAEDAETYLCTRTSGVYADEDCFDLTISDGMTVKISPGIAWIRNTDYTGKSICMDTAQTLTLSIGDSKPRTDRIVLRFDQANNESVLDILEGTPDSDYPAPDVTQEESIYELGLYSIYIDAAATSLSAADITDTRLDEDVCGLMSDGVTKIPTATLQAQAEELLEDLRAAIEDVEGEAGLMLSSVYDPAEGARQVAFDDDVTALSNTVSNVSSNVTALSNTVGNVYSNVNTLTNTVSNISSNVNTLTNTVANVTSEVTELSNSVADVTELVGDLEDAMGDAGISTESAYHNGSGNWSLEVGYKADARSDYDTAIGASALAYGGDGASTAVGADSSAKNCAVAVGCLASANQYGVAIGYQSGANTAGSVTIGYNTDTASNSIVSIGYNATTANCGVVIGYNALAYMYYGTVIGYNAVASSSFGVAVGSTARANSASVVVGANGATGLGAISIGYNAYASNYSVAIGCDANTSYENSVAIGYGATATGSNSIQLGNDSVSNLFCAVDLTVTSDIRDKTDIVALENGATTFLSQIHPILYVKNDRERYINESTLTDEERKNREKFGLCRYDSEAHEAGTKKDDCVRAGVSAQEVRIALASVYGDPNYCEIVKDNLSEFDIEEIPEGVENKLSVTYAEFIPFLIKAVQELSARISALEG